VSGWVTLYDVAVEPFRWGNAGEGLAALALVALGAAVSAALRRRGLRGATAVMSLVCGVAAFFVVRTLDHREDHERCVEAARRGEGEVVEGTVERFRPVTSVWRQPWSEEFELGGKRIRYPLIGGGCGFHRVLAEGGPIREGQRLRLRLWNDEILRLEMADRDAQALPVRAVAHPPPGATSRP
jgi:hypothetical protein